MKIVKRVLLGFVALLVVVLSGGGIYACVQVSAFDDSMNKVYDVPVPKIERSSDPEVLARGKHLTESIVPCSVGDCHGEDFGGGKTIELGPLGKMTGPNITTGGLGASYTDGEIARLLKHGIKKDGKGVRFMPAMEWVWLRDSDVVAIISYLRTRPAVERPNGPFQIGTLAKVLDRKDMLPFDVARRIEHTKDESMTPVANATYGQYVGRACKGCHGEHLSGGPIPGAPANIPVPLNLTPHETGLKDWTYEDFQKLLKTGERKSGKKLDPFMPIQAFGKMDDIEMKACWDYLRTVPPLAYGNR